MSRVYKHLIAILFVILIAGCAGGGCSGCGGCSGVTPLAEGFKPDARIENAGSVRLTDSGIKFLQDNLGTLSQQLLGGMGAGGVIQFPIPSTSGSQFGIDYTICKDGAKPNGNPPECTAEIDLGNAALTLSTKTPHTLDIAGTIPLRLQLLPIDVVYLFIPDHADMVLNGNQACPPDAQDYAQLPIDIPISIEIDADKAHARYGYSRIKIGPINVDKDALGNSITFCGGSFTPQVLNSVTGYVVDLLYDQLIGTLQSTIEDQLCQKANPDLKPTCPTGTNDVNGTCRYGTKDTDECASILVGLDGHADLAALLASISPGTKGGLDFVFAAGGSSLRPDNSGFAFGDLDPANGGATLGMYGGAEPVPTTKCVPLSNLPLPTGIPIPDELIQNSVPDWPAAIPGPHVGIGLSERFANYALSSVYNSGMLCIGISTQTIDLLNSGTLGLVANSLKDLGLQQETQQIAITIRPQQAPTVKFGNGTDNGADALIHVGMKEASFDFYIWSLDRFIRFMTATFDLDVPLNLTVTKDGTLQPVLAKLGVSNAKVTNSALLREDPETLASTLQDLIGGLVGQQLGSGLPAINLNDSLASLGLTLNIPESVDGKGSPGLRKLSKDTDNYLGIFASLGIAPAMPAAPKPGGKYQIDASSKDPALAVAEADTSAELVRKDVDPAGVRLNTMTRENAPLVRVHMVSTLDDGTRPMQYAYRVDNGFWHPYTNERIVDIDDPWIRLQGRHIVEVRSRVAGQAATTDETPARLEVLIDVEAPSIKVGKVENGSAPIAIKDFVSGSDERVAVRTKLDNGAWSEWTNAGELKAVQVGEANAISVEARDEEGNIGTATQALIRGGPIQGAAGACGCVVAGADESSSKLPWALGVAIAAIALRIGSRRRREPRAEASSKPALKSESKPAPRAARVAATVARGLGSFTALALIASWAGCACGEEATISAYSCDSAKGCQTLTPGLIGEYTSAAVTGSTIWVAGYAEGNWNDSYSWGDLAVGKWSGDKVDWTLVDGVPNETPADPALYNKNGFRGGQTEPGDDVGLWTSIALDENGNPSVAYYDRTNHALKFAQSDGKMWTVSTVQSKDKADIGKYAKLAIVDGKPMIAYLAIEPGGDNGALVSGVRLATAATATPGEGDWTFEDVVMDKQTPCRASFCGSSEKCVKSTGQCTATSMACPDKCASGTACVEDDMGVASCVDISDGSVIDSYPVVVGAYVALAVGPKGDVGIAYYDRIRGDLGIASKASGSWTTMIVDGSAGGVDNGDKGIGATLAIDGAGDWHLAYSDGQDETVRYLRVAQGTTPSTPEVVDDGSGIEGDSFTDGQHIVGDDANILVTPSGEVHITYQDATAGTLRHAIGSPSGEAHSWLIKAIDQKDRFAGAFSRLLEVDSKLMLMNWWRVGGRSEVGVVGDVAIVNP